MGGFIINVVNRAATAGFKIIFRKMLKFTGFLGVAHFFGRLLSMVSATRL
jgi:hypothetical protein